MTLIRFVSIFIVMAFSSHGINAQEIQYPSDSFEMICSLYAVPSFKGTLSLKSPSPAAKRAVQWIADTVGLLPNFVVYEGKFGASPIAFAAIRNSTRYIVYDGDLRFKDGSSQLNWGDLAIMAHEVAHHIAGHTSIGSETPYKGELEADAFAGWLLYKKGATIKQATAWTKILGRSSSASHPGRKDRIAAIKAGWSMAQSQAINDTSTCAFNWLGDELEINGKYCRIAQYCGLPKHQPKLACQDEASLWRWVESSDI